MPLSFAFILDVSGSRKIISKFVEATGQNTICGIEGLFDAITVVAVDVYVENARESAEEFKNREYDVIYIAKTRSLALLCVMEAASPVDSNVGSAIIEPLGCTCT